MSKTSDRYVKIVAWSDEDEWIQLHEAEGRPLPRPTSLREIEALV